MSETENQALFDHYRDLKVEDELYTALLPAKNTRTRSVHEHRLDNLTRLLVLSLL